MQGRRGTCLSWGGQYPEISENKMFQCRPFAFYNTFAVSKGIMLDLLVLYWDWVQMTHQKRTVLLGKLSGQTSPNELHIRGLDTKREQSDQRWGSGSGKIFATTPFRSLESAPFCKKVAIERGCRAPVALE